MLKERRPHSDGRVNGRILVAEDDPEMRRLLISILRDDGYQVDAVSDGEHLMTSVFCQPEAFDLIVSDIRLPRRTGLDVIECLRHRGYRGAVVLMTAFGDASTRERAIEAGAAYIDKPFEVRQLTEAVESLLGDSTE